MHEPEHPSMHPPLHDKTTTVEELRAIMRRFLDERKWQKYHTPKNLAMSVAVEAAELMELFQWLTPEEAAERVHQDAAFRKAVGEELADTLMYLLSLANACDLDVASTIEAKMAKNRKKYPPEKFQGHYQRPLPSE